VKSFFFRLSLAGSGLGSVVQVIWVHEQIKSFIHLLTYSPVISYLLLLAEIRQARS